MQTALKKVDINKTRFNKIEKGKNKMNFKSKLKNILSAALAVSMLLSGFTPITTYAAQSNDYVDPADSWLETNNRTNELDANATVTSGTQFCFVC